MPIFVSSLQEFMEVAKRASECRVKRLEKEGALKVKARTKRYLYTYKAPLSEAEEVLKRVREVCSNIREL